MLTIHPQRGFLNTEFSVQESDCEAKGIRFKIVLKHAFDNHGLTADVETPTFCQVDYGQPYKIKFGRAGIYKLESISPDGESQEFVVEDAVKLGGGSFKRSFVFEGTPWCFIVMNDRTYFYNRETGEQYVETISPDKVEFINRNFVIVSNDSDNSVFSLLRRRPVYNFKKLIFKNEHILIASDNEEDNSENIVSTLNIVDLNGAEISELKLRYDKYFINEKAGALYVLDNDTIASYSLDMVSKLGSWVPGGKVVCFVDGGYAIINAKKYAPWYFPVYSVETHEIKFTICHKGPITKIFDSNIAEPEEFQEKIVAALKHYEDVAAYADVSLTLTNISEVFCSQDNLYYILEQTIYSWGVYGVKRIQCVKTLWNDRNEKVAALDSDFKICQYKEERYLINGKRNIIVNGDNVRAVGFDIHVSPYGRVFSLGNNDGTESLFKGSSEWRRGKFDWSQFHKLGIIEMCSGGIIYVSNNVLEQRIYANGSRASLFRDNNEVLKFGEYVLAQGNTRIIDKSISFPEKWDSVSEDCNYLIGLSGTHVYLYTKVGDSKISYTQHEILEDIFDSSAYGRVLLSDDGDNILYQDGPDMVLLNPTSGKSDRFENTHYITRVNGNRPIFKVDGSHRRARLFDPISNAEINQDYIVNYKFISPDDRLYASSKLSDYTKYYNKISGREVSKDVYLQMRDEYKDNLIDYDSAIRKRKAFVALNKRYFDSLKDYNAESIIYSSNFCDAFLESRGYAKILETSTDQTVAEIPLGPELWFLNYVSFSYDSRYVAIAGRYPNNSNLGGLFLVYDLLNKKNVVNDSSGYAVWRTAFTKDNIVAAYTSLPTTYIANMNESSSDVNQISGKSFLAFSPDGNYIALSKQGYVRYKNEYTEWGHRPSTEVSIYSVCQLKNIVSYNDLANSGIEGTFRANTTSAVSFSSHNEKLMMVGNDGTVVIRNLHLDESNVL